jgi:hypothetical protein
MLIFILRLGLEASTPKGVQSGGSDVGDTQRTIKHNKILTMLLQQVFSAQANWSLTQHGS